MSDFSRTVGLPGLHPEDIEARVGDRVDDLYSHYFAVKLLRIEHDILSAQTRTIVCIINHSCSLLIPNLAQIKVSPFSIFRTVRGPIGVSPDEKR
ncbi:MAG: hypothetical protein GDA43_11755 [Hormoscilla sp. SP5CHS1]|nr:hypothetical protein [Hormoscilla sp. SP5CHS1]